MIDDGEVFDRERRLRALRLDRRAAQEELEATVAEADASGRTLAVALRELGERGDRCAVEVGPHRLVGLVTHVGEDLVRLDAGDGRCWDIALARVALVQRDAPGRATHRVGVGHPYTLLARGRELVVAEAVVELGRVDRPGTLLGRAVAASTTHLELDRGGAGVALVPWPTVAWLAG